MKNEQGTPEDGLISLKHVVMLHIRHEEIFVCCVQMALIE
jgi:hypothetical protein